MKKLILIIAVCGSIFGCAPTLQKASIETPESYIYGCGFSADTCSCGGEWWENFGDTTLNRLMGESLKHNRELSAAVANLEAARNYIWVARSEFLPSLALEAGAEAEHINSVRSEEYTLAPTIDWEISLFGAMRNTKRAAINAYFSKEWNFKALELAITAEVATTYFTLLQYERSYNIACRSFALRQRATALVDSLYTHGMSNGIALQQAKSLVYSAESEVYRYKRAVNQTQLALDVLLGHTPQRVDNSSIGLKLIDDQLPPDVPIGLPSDLIERRPDVMESYFAMQSAAAKVGIARAERYPTISLTGEGGFISSSLKDIAHIKPLGWSVTANITQPILSFGKLKRQERQLKEEYNASLYDYEQTVLEAFSEVEKALVAISTYRYQSRSAASLVVANSNIAYTTQTLYRSGMGDYLSVIDAERELYSSQIDFIEIVTQQYLNYIDLYKALGGGW